jgi:hypothetical protein
MATRGLMSSLFVGIRGFLARRLFVVPKKTLHREQQDVRHSRSQFFPNAAIAVSRVACGKMDVHIQGDPTGAALA